MIKAAGQWAATTVNGERVEAAAIVRRAAQGKELEWSVSMLGHFGPAGQSASLMTQNPQRSNMNFSSSGIRSDLISLSVMPIVRL